MGIEPILPRSQHGVQTTTLATPLARPERLELPTPWFVARYSDPTELKALYWQGVQDSNL